VAAARRHRGSARTLLWSGLVTRVIGFLLILALGVAGALVLVSERREATHAGYRIARLERERLRLAEENRQLQARVARLKTPGEMLKRAKEMELDVRPPEERLKELLKEQETTQPDAATRQGGTRR